MRKKIHAWLWLVLILFSVVGLLFYPPIGYLALICMLGPVITAFFWGRYWCGWFCPRGSFYDHLIAPLSPKKQIPPFLKTMTTRIFILVSVMGLFLFQIVNAWGDWSAIGFIFIRMILSTTIVGIILGIFVHHRTWCNFCPMGTMAHLAARGKKPLKISPKCIGCKACVKVCPMQIDIPAYKEKGLINHPDCLKCGKCLEKCPQKFINY